MRVARGRNVMSGHDDVLSCDTGPATDLGMLSDSHDYSMMQMRIATSLYFQSRASRNKCITRFVVTGQASGEATTCHSDDAYF